MPQWWVTHIDALIPGVLGIIICIKAFFWPERDSSSLDNAKRRQLLRVCGVALVAVGISRFITESVRASAASSSSSPVTVSTDDGMVSAEFPQPPVRQEAIDEAPGVKVHRITRECDLDGSRINLRLSYNEYAPGGKDAPVPAMLANMEQVFKQQGFDLTKNTELPDSIHEMVLDRPSDGARMVFRIWFGPEGVYRVLATTLKGSHDDPRAARLISSFRRTAAAKSK
jgi:hypothetical protein